MLLMLQITIQTIHTDITQTFDKLCHKPIITKIREI